MQCTVYGPPAPDARALLPVLEYTSDAFEHIGLGVHVSQLGAASPMVGDSSRFPGPDATDPRLVGRPV